MRWLSLSLITVVLVATIGLGWVFDVVYQHYAGDAQNDTADEIQHAEILTKQLADTLAESGDAQQFVAIWQNSEGYQLRVLPLAELVLPESLLVSLSAGNTLNLESDTDISIHRLIPKSESVLIMEIPSPEETAQQSNNRYWFTSLFYLLLILLFLLWAQPLITRLLQLRKTARAFGKGELSQRIRVGKVSYISDLETEFNHMAQRIEDLVSDVKLLSSAVSHDLRTPLARIRMGLDTLSEETDPVKRQAYEDRINEHIDDMVELIETLLGYARLDQAMLELERKPIDISQLLHKLVEKKQQPDKSITLNHNHKSAMVSGDPTYLKMLFSNLLQNALQHAQHRVHIEIGTSAGALVIWVADDGPGIAADMQSDVFKPFVRSRNSKHKGHGVGLAICKRVVDWHQGSIEVQQSANLKGAEFMVTLPKATTIT
ncbi:ATP-binding protein [Planctobacterium marinum]|uniref:histidine kinase n=1 Tax=Planctobacterium marinum TaxID=1631968 RepID=A0AA48KUD6_9ALTE|nr:two-component sensor histidine kinase [Planctobacterium marinum]